MYAVGHSVITSSGSILGHAAPIATNVSEYLGIPFARQPVGDLRFAAPQPYNSSDAFNATNFGPTCASNGVLGDPGITGPAYPFFKTVNFGPQGIDLLNNEAQANYPSAEDCLTLNVWTKPQSGEAAKAVMVWLYGGGLNFGSTKDPWYNGQFLADKQDVVAVTVNYRTNIFGFPGAPNLPAQNVGLLDQRLAIEWVRDNIAGFGGDPKRITLFGQSAGSASVDYYSFAYYDNDPILNGMIMESGTAITEGGVQPQQAAGLWYEYTEQLGCGGPLDNQGAVLACMRNKTTAQILTAIGGAPGLSQISKSTQFNPVVDNKTAFGDYGTRAQAGQFIHRPLLIGNTDDEAGIAQPVAQALSGQPFPQPVIDYLNLAGFDCPTRQRADYQAAAGVATWRYRWFGVFPNTAVSYSPASGAYHESEIPIVFGSNAEYRVADTPVEAGIVAYIQGAWAAFAKDPDAGLAAPAYGWPKYAGGDAASVLRLAYMNRTGPNPAPASTYDAACPLADPPSSPSQLFANAMALAKHLGWSLGNSTL